MDSSTKLKNVRLIKGLSQHDVSLLTDGVVWQSELSMYENGRAALSEEKINAIKKALGLSHSVIEN